MSKRKKPLNPFIYEGYEGKEYFCDRKEETETLISNLSNGRNTTLVSPRKMGKTGLIMHVFETIKSQNEDAICIYVDIFHTQNQHEFIQALGRAIVQEHLINKHRRKNKFMQFLGTLRPSFSIDPQTGTPSISVDIDKSNTEHSIQSIFNLLDGIGEDVYIAIDEFQTITDYPEKGTEALLRSYIQFIHNVHFIFSGSKMHLMYEMFGSPKRPFYQSTSILSLSPLHEEIYYEFSKSFFEAQKLTFSKDIFHELYHGFGGHTWYIQSILNRLYESGISVTEASQLQEAIQSIVKEKSAQYESLTILLTPNQFTLLKAIAEEGRHCLPLSKSFSERHTIPPAGSLKRTLDFLSDKELVYRSKEGYIVYDRFMGIWLRNL